MRVLADGCGRIATPRRVGLLGGSFDPPHAGHLHVTRQALRALRLQQVWWIVSPGNPLKRAPDASLERRLRAARRMVAGSRNVRVSEVEAQWGTRYTVDTLRRLLRAAPASRFVWIMGADSLVGLHRWKAWSRILRLVPVAVLPRPGAQVRAGLSFAARRFARCRLPQRAAGRLMSGRPPAWCLLGGPMRSASSTAIRRRAA